MSGYTENTIDVIHIMAGSEDKWTTDKKPYCGKFYARTFVFFKGRKHATCPDCLAKAEKIESMQSAKRN